MIRIDCPQNAKVSVDWRLICALYGFIKACKYLANEISESLLEHNSHDVIQTDYNLDDRLKKKNAKKYKDR
jgi:hypothetical protein